MNYPSPGVRPLSPGFASPIKLSTSLSGSGTTSVPTRYVAVNDDEANRSAGFAHNEITTSKYNIVTFLPRTLFHQFRQVSNFYFLINVCFVLVPGAAPVAPASAIAPLCLVVFIGLVREAYDDIQRHRHDAEANALPTQVLRKTAPDSTEFHVVSIPSKSVVVGDVLLIEKGDQIRADVLLLSSSAPEGNAFIDTCNLDGETNLKGRKALEETWHLHSAEVIGAVRDMMVVTTPPDSKLHSWHGYLRCGDDADAVSPLGIEQFLYRGAVLRNTDWAWGLVVYAGKETKMMMNLIDRPPKKSSLDHKLDLLIIGLVIVEHALLFTLCSLAVHWEEGHTHLWYLHGLTSSGAELWFLRYLSYFVLLGKMIPISLFVTIELCKLVQSRLMSWDHSMLEWMNEKWVHCTPNTSNLNEQLSAVKFIFSDKTGTLTENVMTYKRGDILGETINADDWSLSRSYLGDEHKSRADALKYFRALALCHTIQPFPDTKPGHEGRLVYDGASPDEVALVRAAVEHNVVLIERTVKTMTLSVFGKEEKYDILATLEFTPDRKMMSIIVRDSAGVITLFTKGADSFVIPNMSKTYNEKLLPPTIATLQSFATEGLRTLIVCSRELTEPEFDAWYLLFSSARLALENRSTLVDNVCLQMEKNLELIGVTAIEDKLQDEVPETLQFFLRAGVIVWMLTGDKRETALTIASTSTLTNPATDYIVHIDVGMYNVHDPEQVAEAIRCCEAQLREVEGCLERADKRVSFVIDGPALFLAMDHHMQLFLDISQRVNSAVCCRLTPLQKANVVKMFQENTGMTALAIGDGANDVSMIQEGRVGVGIMGLEGAQAALAADYAIPRFKHLRRLCCVHGRYAVARNAMCVVTSLYKGFLIAALQFIFAFLCGFSGQTLLDGWLLTLFNLWFTTLQPFLLGCFEKDIPEVLAERDPELYADLRDGEHFNPLVVATWYVTATFHSLILFIAWGPAMASSTNFGEKPVDLVGIGVCFMSAIILLSIGKMALHTRYWTMIQVFGVVFSAAVTVSLFFAYSSVPNLFKSTGFHGQAKLFSDVKFWLIVGLACSLLFVFDLPFQFIRRRKCGTRAMVAMVKYLQVDDEPAVFREPADLPFTAFPPPLPRGTPHNREVEWSEAGRASAATASVTMSTPREYTTM